MSTLSENVFSFLEKVSNIKIMHHHVSFTTDNYSILYTKSAYESCTIMYNVHNWTSYSWNLLRKFFISIWNLLLNLLNFGLNSLTTNDASRHNYFNYTTQL